MTKVVKDFDVLGGKPWPSSALSNFAAHAFVFRGVACASMEGLLQSLKTADPQRQLYICTLTGKEAKREGSQHNAAWQSAQSLWWQGQPMARQGQAYQEFLAEAYDALCDGARSFRSALRTTELKNLTHSIGEPDPTKTVLTEAEFMAQLNRQKTRLQPLNRRQTPRAKSCPTA